VKYISGMLKLLLYEKIPISNFDNGIENIEYLTSIEWLNRRKKKYHKAKEQKQCYFKFS